MKKVFSGTMILLLIGGFAYAIPTTIRVSSSRPNNISSAAVVTKKPTTPPQSLASIPEKTTTITTETIKTETSTGTERIGGIKYLKGTSLSTAAQQKPTQTNTPSETNTDTNALHAQLTAMQSQIEQLQRELSKKAEIQDVQELNTSLNNQLKNYASTDDIEDKITSTNNKIAALNSKINTVAMDAKFEEGSIKRIFNQFLDTELDKTSDDNKFYRFATKNELNTTKAEIATDVATKKAEAIAAAAADAAEKYDSQINTLNTKITNVASGQIDETALSGHFNKFLTIELGKSDGKFKDFARTDDVDVAKNAAIAAAEIKANEAKDSAIAAAADSADRKFATSDDIKNFLTADTLKIAIANQKILDGYAKTNDIDTAISDKGFLTADTLEPAIANKKILDGYAKTDDVDVAKNAAIAAAEIKANEAKDSAIAAAADSADRKFATSDDIKNFLTADTLEPAIANKKILDGYAKTNDIDTAISSKGFLTADTLEPAIANKKILDGYAKTDDVDVAISSKGFLTADTLEPAIANKKILDGYAKTDDVDIAKNAAIAAAEIKANEAKNSAIAAAADSADRKFATNDDIKNFLTADTLESAIANQKILDGYAKTDDVNTAINTAKTEAINTAGTVTDTKLANYTPTSGLSDIISNKINTDLADENSYLAKQFANLEKEFDKYQKIEDTPYELTPDVGPTMEP